MWQNSCAALVEISKGIVEEVETFAILDRVRSRFEEKKIKL
jgi:hypothetical protein